MHTVIDSHQHVFWHGRDDAGLVADMDEHGIDRAWLLTWEIAPDEYDPIHPGVLNPANHRTQPGIPLADLIRARDRYPDRFVLGYCPHPLMGPAAELFESAYHMHGVRVCGEWKFRSLFDDPRSLELFTKAGELGCPVVLHLDVPYLHAPQRGGDAYQPRWYGGTIDNLRRALVACPRTNFIGHAPGFWREISGDAATDPAPYPQGPVAVGGRLDTLFEEHPNLYADLSSGSGLTAFSRDPGHARGFIDRHQDRLLFGRDRYGGELAAFIQSLELPETIRAKLFHDNAHRLVPTPTPTPTLVKT